MQDDPLDTPLPGVSLMDHTADVGLELRAADLASLLCRAAAGLGWLLHEAAPAGPAEDREVHARGESPAALLRELLRELLWWHEAEGTTPVELLGAVVEQEEKGLRLTGSARLVRDPRPPVREIKGVTLHGLVAEPRDGGWYGQVILDV